MVFKVTLTENHRLGSLNKCKKLSLYSMLFSKHNYVQKWMSAKRGSRTFRGSSVGVIVGVRVINAVRVGGGKVTGINKVLIVFTLVAYWRGRDV